MLLSVDVHQQIPTLQSVCAQQAALRGEEVTQAMDTKPEAATLRCPKVECCDNSSHTVILELEGAHEQPSETSVEVADALEGNVQIPALLEGVHCEMEQDEWRQSNSSKNVNAQFLPPMEDMLENEGEFEIQQSACGTGNELLEVSETSEVMEVHLKDLALKSEPSDVCLNVTAPSEVPFLQKYGDEQPRGALVTQMEAGTEMKLDAYTQLETVIVADLSDAPIMHPVATETISSEHRSTLYFFFPVPEFDVQGFDIVHRACGCILHHYVCFLQMWYQVHLPLVPKWTPDTWVIVAS